MSSDAVFFSVDEKEDIGCLKRTFALLKMPPTFLKLEWGTPLSNTNHSFIIIHNVFSYYLFRVINNAENNAKNCFTIMINKYFVYTIYI